MTPNEIEVLLHCYTSLSVHPRIQAPAVKEAISMFLGCDILIKASGVEWYTTTGRGEALVKVLCNTKFPTEAWVDENGKVIK